MRAVYGPAGLLDITADARGNTSARPVLARGRGASHDRRGGIERERRRGRAPAGRAARGRARLVPDRERPPRSVLRRHRQLAAGGAGRGRAALAEPRGSSLAPASSGGLEARPLWPDPRGRGGGCPLGVRGGLGRSSRWWRCGVRGAARRRCTAGGAWRRRWRPRPAPPRRSRSCRSPACGVAGGLAALAAGLIALGGASGARRRPARRRRPGVRAASVLAVARSLRRWAARCSAVAAGRHAAVERVADVLRQRAWRLRRAGRAARGPPPDRRPARAARRRQRLVRRRSVHGRHVGRRGGRAASPTTPSEVRRILVQARTDPAVRLELAGDHREALIGGPLRRRSDGRPPDDRRAPGAATSPSSCGAR